MTRNQLIKKINSLLLKKFGEPFQQKQKPEPLDILIATILSQNTNDRNSFKAYQNLKQKYSGWEELTNATKKEIENVIRVAGLARQKSASIKQIINSLSNKSGKINLDFLNDLDNDQAVAELTKFSGVGVKTASCVLLFSLGRDVCPVDTHVHRTLNRIGLVKTSAPDKTHYGLNNKFPKGIAHSFHTNLLRLGREYCRPTNPKCSACPLFKVCNYPDKNLNDSTPLKANSFMLLDSV